MEDPQDNPPPVTPPVETPVIPPPQEQDHSTAGVRPPGLRPEKTADRPHRITIALGLLSPVLATIAVIISGITLINSQRALKISQRAYVDARLSIDHQPDFPSIWNLTIEFDNTGNTPATVFKVTPQAIARLHSSVAESFLQMNDSVQQRLVVAGKQSGSKVEIGAMVVSKDQKFPCNFCSLPIPDIHVDYIYRDVFGAEHNGSVECGIGLIVGNETDPKAISVITTTCKSEISRMDLGTKTWSDVKAYE